MLCFVISQILGDMCPAFSGVSLSFTPGDEKERSLGMRLHHADKPQPECSYSNFGKRVFARNQKKSHVESLEVVLILCSLHINLLLTLEQKILQTCPQFLHISIMNIIDISFIDLLLVFMDRTSSSSFSTVFQ